MIAPRFWARERPGLARAGAGAARRALRRWRRRGAWRGRACAVDAPVICVGNYVVGGAGKTPTAIAVARLLQSAGERVAFLSRGYGGARRDAPTRVDPQLHGALAVGDEPLLLARVAPCWVGADRVAAAREAIADGASVLVLDDGLQNPALAKDYAIAVIDGEAGFGNGLCFPAGPLRAPPARQAPYRFGGGGGRRRTSPARGLGGGGKPLVPRPSRSRCDRRRRADRPAGARLRRHRPAGEILRHARRRSARSSSGGDNFPIITSMTRATWLSSPARRGDAG